MQQPIICSTKDAASVERAFRCLYCRGRRRTSTSLSLTFPRITTDNPPSTVSRSLFSTETQRSCASRLMQPLQPHHIPPRSSDSALSVTTISSTAESVLDQAEAVHTSKTNNPAGGDQVLVLVARNTRASLSVTTSLSWWSKFTATKFVLESRHRGTCPFIAARSTTRSNSPKVRRRNRPTALLPRNRFSRLRRR